MIISFADKATKHIWEGIKIKKLSVEIQEIARRKLRIIRKI